ncbi:hypothetical protein JOQ06_007423, partial [Pogonophryne albipinna]
MGLKDYELPGQVRSIAGCIGQHPALPVSVSHTPVLSSAVLAAHRPGPKSPAVSVLAEQWGRVFYSVSGSSRLDTVSSIVSVSPYPLWSFLAPEPHGAQRRLGWSTDAGPFQQHKPGLSSLRWALGRRHGVLSTTMPGDRIEVRTGKPPINDSSPTVPNLPTAPTPHLAQPCCPAGLQRTPTHTPLHAQSTNWGPAARVARRCSNAICQRSMATAS